jgi:phosphonate transport system permease protein
MTAGLLIASWSYLVSISEGRTSIFTNETVDRSSAFVTELLGVGSDSWSSANWGEVVGLAADTIAMSVIAAVMAGSAALAIIPFAARKSSHKRGVMSFVAFAMVRFSFIFTRSVPELLWALIVIFIISPGILAGAVALAIHNFGVIGRLGADTVEDLDDAPIDALRSSGASASQRYFTGVLPLAARQLVTFLLYRWEVIIRTTAVVGFVAASGIGYQLRLDMSFFRYAEVGQLLLAYLVIVWSIDLISVMVRRSIR